MNFYTFMLLQINHCSLSFGGIKAIQRFHTTLQEEEFLGIIGPNGAGKTTLFNLLTGIYKPDEGEILLKNRSTLKLSPHEINQSGVARTFQNIRLFQNLSVEENVLIAYHHNIQSSLVASSFLLNRVLKEESVLQKNAFDLLEIFGLLDRRNELAKNLSYGEQRRLEIVRALATKPQILLLDEPAAGMNLTEKHELIRLIREVNKNFQVAIMMIEHDMSVVMSLCPRIIVLNFGEVLAEGNPEEIRKNPKVIEAYLGEKIQK